MEPVTGALLAIEITMPMRRDGLVTMRVGTPQMPERMIVFLAKPNADTPSGKFKFNTVEMDGARLLKALLEVNDHEIRCTLHPVEEFYGACLSGEFVTIPKPQN